MQSLPYKIVIEPMQIDAFYIEVFGAIECQLYHSSRSISLLLIFVLGSTSDSCNNYSYCDVIMFEQYSYVAIVG